MTGRNHEITLLQLDGEVSREELMNGLEMAKKGCSEIIEVQKKALRESVKVSQNE